jgi:hypothetical protein
MMFKIIKLFAVHTLYIGLVEMNCTTSKRGDKILVNFTYFLLDVNRLPAWVDGSAKWQNGVAKDRIVSCGLLL